MLPLPDPKEDRMKDDILQKLSAVIAALDSIAVTGQNNRGNLYGSIAMLEQIAQTLQTAWKEGEAP